MNVKRFLKNFFIVSGILGILIIIIFVLNIYLGVCNGGNDYDNTIKKCFYYNETCNKGENLTSFNEKSTCIYDKKGFLDTEYITYFLWFLGVSWFLIGIIFIIIRIKGKEGKDKLHEISEFRKEDFVSAKRARELWAKRMCERNNIMILGENYKKSAFNFYNKTEPFQSGKEWLYRFQCEVKEGDNPGIYTVNTSLSRGEKWIGDDMYREQHCCYDDFKVARSMPLRSSEDPRERLLESLYERHPERAIQIQDEMLEKGITQPQQSPQQELSEQQMMMTRMPYRPSYGRYRQPYRQPWRRY